MIHTSSNWIVNKPASFQPKKWPAVVPSTAFMPNSALTEISKDLQYHNNNTTMPCSLKSSPSFHSQFHRFNKLPIPYDFKTLYQAWKSSWESGFRSPRFLLSAAFYTGASLGLWMTNNAAFIIDEILYPDFRKQPVKNPTFILANPRSGTTLLHRLLSNDEQKFVTFQLYQTLFPSIIAEKIFHTIRNCDQRLGSPVMNILGKADRQLFAFWKDIHKVGFSQPEECVQLWLATLKSPALYMIFPSNKPLEEIDSIDSLSLSEQKRWLEYYRECLQRRLYTSGNIHDGIFLTKNVLLTGAIKGILAEFPDAHVIYLVRNPYETIPSSLSLFHSAMKLHSPGLAKNSPPMRNIERIMNDYYLRLMEITDLLPEKRFKIISYDSLVSNPDTIVKKIYHDFGWQISPQMENYLAEIKNEQNSREKRHHYTLEEYGTSRDQVYQNLKPVFDKFGFKK